MAERVRRVWEVRSMRIEAFAFWESTYGRKKECWRASEHQDADNKQK